MEISFYGSALPIYADASQIEMVIMNLAINAKDAMPAGGTFNIRMSKRDPVAEAGSVESHPVSHAVLELRDTGEGMSEDVLSHIFEPFFTTKEVGEGTGLGLSTVYGIVKRAGGQIKVDSEPGRGTTFCVLFPIKDEDRGAAAAQKRDAPPDRGSETILLAEDEADIRTMTRVYLEGLGYRVLEASDGAQAVRVSKEYPWDVQLLLTDIQMPEMRGDLMAEEITKTRPKIRVLYATGYAESVQDDGQKSVIYKPFEFPELGRKIRDVLDAA
jgi:CheY-like chemotaxis protein